MTCWFRSCFLCCGATSSAASAAPNESTPSLSGLIETEHGRGPNEHALQLSPKSQRSKRPKTRDGSYNYRSLFVSGSQSSRSIHTDTAHLTSNTGPSLTDHTVPMMSNDSDIMRPAPVPVDYSRRRRRSRVITKEDPSSSSTMRSFGQNLSMVISGLLFGRGSSSTSSSSASIASASSSSSSSGMLNDEDETQTNRNVSSTGRLRSSMIASRSISTKGTTTYTTDDLENYLSEGRDEEKTSQSSHKVRGGLPSAIRSLLIPSSLKRARNQATDAREDGDRSSFLNIVHPSTRLRTVISESGSSSDEKVISEGGGGDHGGYTAIDTRENELMMPNDDVFEDRPTATMMMINESSLLRAGVDFSVDDTEDLDSSGMTSLFPVISQDTLRSLSEIILPLEQAASMRDNIAELSRLFHDTLANLDEDQKGCLISGMSRSHVKFEEDHPTRESVGFSPDHHYHHHHPHPHQIRAEDAVSDDWKFWLELGGVLEAMRRVLDDEHRVSENERWNKHSNDLLNTILVHLPDIVQIERRSFAADTDFCDDELVFDWGLLTGYVRILLSQCRKILSKEQFSLKQQWSMDLFFHCVTSSLARHTEVPSIPSDQSVSEECSRASLGSASSLVCRTSYQIRYSKLRTVIRHSESEVCMKKTDGIVIKEESNEEEQTDEEGEEEGEDNDDQSRRIERTESEDYKSESDESSADESDSNETLMEDQLFVFQYIARNGGRTILSQLRSDGVDEGYRDRQLRLFDSVLTQSVMLDYLSRFLELESCKDCAYLIQVWRRIYRSSLFSERKQYLIDVITALKSKESSDQTTMALKSGEESMLRGQMISLLNAAYLRCTTIEEAVMDEIEVILADMEYRSGDADDERSQPECSHTRTLSVTPFALPLASISNNNNNNNNNNTHIHPSISTSNPTGRGKSSCGSSTSCKLSSKTPSPFHHGYTTTVVSSSAAVMGGCGSGSGRSSVRYTAIESTPAMSDCDDVALSGSSDHIGTRKTHQRVLKELVVRYQLSNAKVRKSCEVDIEVSGRSTSELSSHNIPEQLFEQVLDKKPFPTHEVMNACRLVWIVLQKRQRWFRFFSTFQRSGEWD